MQRRKKGGAKALSLLEEKAKREKPSARHANDARDAGNIAGSGTDFVVPRRTGKGRFRKESRVIANNNCLGQKMHLKWHLQQT